MLSSSGGSFLVHHYCFQIGHGLLKAYSKVAYRGVSGGLNEAFADFVGLAMSDVSLPSQLQAPNSQPGYRNTPFAKFGCFSSRLQARRVLVEWTAISMSQHRGVPSKARRTNPLRNWCKKCGIKILLRNKKFAQRGCAALLHWARRGAGTEI